MDCLAEKDILLKRFVGDFRKISGVEGCVITSSDGAILASDVSGKINEEELGAITIFSAGIGAQLDLELKLGSLEKIVVEGPDYKIISIQTGPVFIGLSTTSNVSVDMISNEVKDVASKLQEVI
ncbi:MAG: roadblock/LC7 domain-containing protein [Candidatus Hydrothermarchaeales archaeon]